jgi:signal transduction histidine kinase
MAERANYTEGQAEIYSGLSSVHLSMGNYEEALANEFKALKIIQMIENRPLEAWTYYNLGTGYHEWGDFQKALQFHRKSLKLFKELRKEKKQIAELGYARALTGIGSAYQSMGRYQKSLEFHLESLKIFKKNHNKIGESRALNDLGTAYQHLGKFKESLQHHQKSLKIREEIGNRQAQCTSLINLGNLYIKERKSEQALNVLIKALRLAKQIKAKPRISQASRALSEAYQQQGQFKQALNHYKIFHDIKEEVSGDEANARLKNLQISYETEQADQKAEIARLKSVELREKNRQLKQLLKELQETQSQLIQSEKMAALGNLVAGVVHEINSPIGALNSATDLSIRSMKQIKNFRDQDISPEKSLQDPQIMKTFSALEENIRVMITASERVNKMVNSLKSFANLDSSPFQKVNLHQNLDNTLTLIENHIGSQIEIIKKYGTLPPVACYPAEINQVFMNLLTNAAESITGKGAITIKTHHKDAQVHIEIQDSGVGIPRDQIKRLFEPGFSKKGKRVKAAIGLFSAYNIIQKHGGEIKASSTVGKGSKFTVILPVQ